MIKSGNNVVTFIFAEDSGSVKMLDVSDKIKNTLETEDHIKYINGYPGGTVRPDNAITRAEVSAIFWRLLKSPAKNELISDSFPDVADGEWYAQAINYLADLGILQGYEDGTFRPNQSITRAEFAAIASRFDDLQKGINNPFADVSADYWAYDYIISAYTKGWISGYPGGGFKSQNSITRAEVVKIVNHMLGRGIKKDDVPIELLVLYPDLPTSHWAFAEMIEASVPHEYSRKPDSFEVWTEWQRP